MRLWPRRRPVHDRFLAVCRADREDLGDYAWQIVEPRDADDDVEMADQLRCFADEDDWTEFVLVDVTMRRRRSIIVAGENMADYVRRYGAVPLDSLEGAP